MLFMLNSNPACRHHLQQERATVASYFSGEGPKVLQVYSTVTGSADSSNRGVLACRKPLPVVFMRLLIGIVQKRPRTLHAFMADKLASLISQSIWTQQIHWKGWLILAEKLMPASYPTLLQVLALANLFNAFVQSVKLNHSQATAQADHPGIPSWGLPRAYS